MASKIQTTTFKPITKVRRRGIHSKKLSKMKASKLYKKKYKGQGK